MRILVILMFLASCTETIREYDNVNSQVTKEEEGYFCKLKIRDIEECFVYCGSNSQSTISCKFYDTIK